MKRSVVKRKPAEAEGSQKKICVMCEGPVCLSPGKQKSKKNGRSWSRCKLIDEPNENAKCMPHPTWTLETASLILPFILRCISREVIRESAFVEFPRRLCFRCVLCEPAELGVSTALYLRCRSLPPLLKSNANPTSKVLVGCSLQSGSCSVVVCTGRMLCVFGARSVHGFGGFRRKSAPCARMSSLVIG